MAEHKRNVDRAGAPILLVDDWPANLLALQAVLSSPDYDLTSVRSGMEALEQVGRRDFAVVLLDVQMPLMDGIETARRMKELGVGRGRQGPVPVIFVTGADADPSRVLSGYASGAVDFIQKPLEPEIIRAKVSIFVELYLARERLLVEIEERERLQAALRAREDLLAVVAHDLRNPLSAVLIGARTIERLADQRDASERTKRTAAAIARAVDQMSRLVGDLLDLAGLEAGQPLPLDLESHDVDLLSRETVELLEPLASSKGLILKSEVTEPTHVLCDGDRVRQVLANLIGNAIKFTRDGGSIHVKTLRTAGEIVVVVSDTGIGIPEDHLPHIFEPYWKIDAERKRGAGLGLAIVKAIVEAHRGRVWVDTASERGTTFRFTLPAADDLARKVDPSCVP